MPYHAFATGAPSASFDHHTGRQVNDGNENIGGDWAGRTAMQDTTETLQKPPAAGRGDLAIAGIGCSAGGFDALERFFSHVPPDSDFAFVVVQHLSPSHPSSLVELLQRCTPLRVQECVDGQRLNAGCVYVVPPNNNLALVDDSLHLEIQAVPRSPALPINTFFQTLADGLKQRAVGVVLSGMGADGVLGLGAIKAGGGLTLVQTPDSAKYDSMPQSAINAGVADVVDLPEALPGLLLEWFRRTSPPDGDVVPSIPETEAAATSDTAVTGLDRMLTRLRDRTGNDFTLYKTSTVLRRVERRIALHQLADIGEYYAYVHANPVELDFLLKEMLIGVTRFFRDPLATPASRLASSGALS
jgi:hypothetical protein